MRYSIQPKDRIYVKGYGFLYFAKYIGTHATKIAKNLSNKYSQKHLDTANKNCFKESNSKSSRSNWRFNW